MEIIQSSLLAKKPFLSIIICSHNSERIVSQTIDSVLSQKHTFSIEIIIGDDCSNDNTKELLINYQKKYPEKIILVFQEENIGLGANWASCVKLCRGKYLAGCDHDDFWHNPDKLQLQVKFLEEHEEFGMVHTDYKTLDRVTNKTKDHIIHDVTYSDSLIKSIFTGKFKCCNSSVVYRKSVIDKYVKLDDYIRHQFTLQDWNTWIMIANHTKFNCLPINTTTVGVTPGSITRPEEYDIISKRLEKEVFLYRYLCDLFPNDLKYDETVYENYINTVFLSLAYKKGDFKRAKLYSGKLIEKGYRNKKVRFSRNWFTFQSYLLLKRILKRDPE